MNAEQRIAELLSEPANLDPAARRVSGGAAAESAAIPAIPAVRSGPARSKLQRMHHSAAWLRSDDGPVPRLVDLVDAMGRAIRRRPAAAVAAAIGAGFLIGGALSFRTGRVLLATGARHLAREVLKQLL